MPGADVNPNPGDEGQLRRYWAFGEGREKWINSPRPYTTLVALLSKYIHSDRQLKGFAAEVFHDALGFWPGTPHEGRVPTPGKKK